MNIDVEKTVESSLRSIQNWKPYGLEWHKNKKGQFESNFKKNIKCVINFNYQGMEITGKNFVLIFGKGFTASGEKLEQFYQLEVMNLERTKLLYSKKAQGRNTFEKGESEKIAPILVQFSSPHFYLVQEPERKKDFTNFVFTRNPHTK